jgi:predicted transcriptional regulator
MNETVTVTIPRELYEELRTIAEGRKSSPERLISTALRWYVENESEFLAAIDEGLADLAAGRVHSHAEVVAEFERRFGKRS